MMLRAVVAKDIDDGVQCAVKRGRPHEDGRITYPDDKFRKVVALLPKRQSEHGPEHSLRGVRDGPAINSV